MNTFKQLRRHVRQGYVALISVILIGALGTAIMLSVILSGVSAGKTDFSLQQSGGARVLASSCAEEALQQISETGTTSTSGNLTIGSGTCMYLVEVQSNQITVNATGFLGTVTNKIKVVLSTTTPNLILSSWQEVADF